MAVSANFRVDTRPFSGYADPALPIASWIAQGGVAGDASGGAVIMNFLFQQSADKRITEMYNVEQASLDTSDNLLRRVGLETLNMDALSPDRPASPQKWFLDVNSVTGISGTALNVRDLAGLPIWLGAPFLPAGSSAAGLRFQFSNIDLILYAITVQGYIWGPRSVLAPGGPQRPPNGFLGR